jgi:putative ABC transport system permease protein
VRYGITRNDFDRIVETIPSVERAVPIRVVTHEVRYGEQAIDVSVVGSSAELATCYPLAIARGRFLTGKETRNSDNVAVLGADTARRLFRERDPIGRNVRIQGQYFLVVGVAKSGERETDNREVSEVHKLYIPITTMRARFGDRVIKSENGSLQAEEYELTEIRVAVANKNDVSATAEVILRVLEATHEIEDYSIEINAP